LERRNYNMSGIRSFGQAWQGQKWEYKTIFRQRGWEGKQESRGWHDAGAWNINIDEEIQKLGEEGYELVAISPRSGRLGGRSDNLTPIDYAGYTDEELWVFKRPKP
jgi:hypothetical protein